MTCNGSRLNDCRFSGFKDDVVSIHSSDVVSVHSSSPEGFKDDDIVSIASSSPSPTPSEAYVSCTSDLDGDDNAALDCSDSNKVDSTGSHTESTAAASRPRSLRIESRLTKKKQESDPASTLLGHFLQKKRLIKPSESLEKAKARWTPHLELPKLTPSIINHYCNDWSFVERYRLNKTITLRCEIVAKRETLEAEKELYLITYFPKGIIEDSWVGKTEIPENGLKVIDTQKLSWEEKQRFAKILEMRHNANH